MVPSGPLMVAELWPEVGLADCKDQGRGFVSHLMRGFVEGGDVVGESLRHIGLLPRLEDR